MENDINLLQQEIARLKHAYLDLKEEITLLSQSQQGSINLTRKRGAMASAGVTCEAILKFIYKKEGLEKGSRPADSLMLEDLIQKLTGYVPAHVQINLRTIQAWRNLGAHDKGDIREIDDNTISLVEGALNSIVIWFFNNYLGEHILVSAEATQSDVKIEVKNETPELSISKVTIDTPMSKASDVKIGQNFGGGLVFYIDNKKKFGLCSAPMDLDDELQWAKKIGSKELGTGEDVGDGITNTKKINEQQVTYFNKVNKSIEPGAGVANLDFSEGGFNDWFLPSIGELALMWENLHLEGMGDYSENDLYWSSTENSSDLAELFDFNEGSAKLMNKNSTALVRLVRKFDLT